MSPRRDSHDFPYAPVPTSVTDDDGEGLDLVVATAVPLEAAAITKALAPVCGESTVEPVLGHAPVFWTRVRAAKACRRADIETALALESIPVRYVASARRQSLVVPPPLDFEGASPLRPTAWRGSRGEPLPTDPDSEGRWFLRDDGGGLAVDRQRCGTGRGTRLAVIDDDAADLTHVDLDDTVLVGIDRLSSGSGHGALLIGWAVGARTHQGPRFLGVAPDASVRAYMIPRPGDDAVSLPLAIARAAIDGADVIVCATYIEGTTSPMLDDALELSTRLGRRRRGCIVVLPTGREASSPRKSIHASLSLSLGDPASDPRVLCVAPGGRGGGWFLWREHHGGLRPFANRGPAVRCMAPGDDVAYPFLAKERLFHAESSGAAALAAGVLLLIVASNPSLRAGEVFTLLARCAAPAEPLAPETIRAMTDRADALPLGRDLDGHDAKHGYGRIHATRACIAAGDPVSLELASMGEDDAAQAWADARRRDPAVAKIYSRRLARWIVRVLLGDPAMEHALRVVLRHMRLLASDPRRSDAHATGAVVRQVALLLRSIAVGPRRPPPSRRRELRALERKARGSTRAAGSVEASLLDLARRVFSPPPPALSSATATEEPLAGRAANAAGV